MFWNLLLAHLAGDFALQPDWMVRNRQKIWVLSLHAAIHFVSMVLLVGQPRKAIWPYLLLIALAHFCQDWYKNRLPQKGRNARVALYLIDQAVHIMLIGAAVGWLQRSAGPIVLPERPTWAVIAVAYLFVTYVWFISERIINLSDADYLKNINETKLSRMFVRAGLVSLVFLVRPWGPPAAASVAIVPYPQVRYRNRALLTDLGVSVCTILFLLWALG